MNEKELVILNKLLNKLIRTHRPKNEVHEEFYNGHNQLDDLGISLPPKLRKLNITPSWAQTAVEALNDRVNLEGFIGVEGSKVGSIFTQNHLDLVSNLAHRDTFIFGSCYLLAGKGDLLLGEPEIIITAESPNFAIADFDPRTKRATSFVKIVEYKSFSYVSLMFPEKTILLKMTKKGSSFTKNKSIWAELKADQKIENLYNIDVEEVDEHELGFIPLVKLVNKPRATDMNGKSEISRPLRQFIMDAQRTFATAVSNREIYSIPRIFIFGADVAGMVDKDKNPIQLDSSYSDNMTVTGTGPNGEIPQLEQLQQGTVSAYMDTLKQYAGEVSTMTGVPITMLGYQNANPTSAESIEASLSMLSKKAEDRTKSFGVSWLQILRYSMLMLGEEMPENVRPKWRNTRITSSGSVAQADAVTKLISAGVLQPDSEITYEMLGFDEARIQQLKTEAEEASLTQTSDLAKAIASSGFTV